MTDEKIPSEEPKFIVNEEYSKAMTKIAKSPLLLFIIPKQKAFFESDEKLDLYKGQ